jgi:hypothetical protein
LGTYYALKDIGGINQALSDIFPDSEILHS